MITLEKFKEENKIENTILLKDTRMLLTTKNGFQHWVVDKKKIVSPVTEEYYNKIKRNRLTKKQRRID